MLKIGVFDSGVGGLTVVQAMRKVIKGAKIVYIADTKNAPYGDKTEAQILQYSLNITQHLLDEHQIDALIIACNTATSAAITRLREKFPELIIIGTEPGIKPAIEYTKSKKVGVLATKATLLGEKYQQLALSLSTKHAVTLFEQPCIGLVEQIENAEIDSPKTKAMLSEWLKPMREQGVDSIVLGCTHYPLVAAVIEEIMQKKIHLVHTGQAISQRLLNLLEEKGHVNQGDLEIFVYYTKRINAQMLSALLPDVRSAHCKIKGQ